jgi:hypothetical protein
MERSFEDVDDMAMLLFEQPIQKIAIVGAGIAGLGNIFIYLIYKCTIEHSYAFQSARPSYVSKKA